MLGSIRRDREPSLAPRQVRVSRFMSQAWLAGGCVAWAMGRNLGTTWVINDESW